MNSKRAVIVEALVIALFALAAAVAIYRSHVLHVNETPPWTPSELAAPRGEEAARLDLNSGVRRVVLYGLIVGEHQISERLRTFGYEWRSGGCLVGGDEYKYWNAYNRVMIEAGRKQFGERFVAALQEDLI